MFSSYTAEQLARTYRAGRSAQVNLLGAVTWAFEFEDQPYFDGFRDLATNGIDKPVVERLPHARPDARRSRVAADEHGRVAAGRRARSQRARRGRTSPRSRRAMPGRRRCSSGTITTTTCRRRRPNVTLTIDGLPAGRPTLTHYRVDSDHSNAYTAWKAMGSPQPPTPAQYAALEKVRAARTAVAAGSRERRRRAYRPDVHAAASGRLAHQDRLVIACIQAQPP